MGWFGARLAPTHRYLKGTGRGERLDGTIHPDFIVGMGGNDHVYAGSGDDIIYGDDVDVDSETQVGDDHLWGGFGNDIIYGGRGIDELVGESGDDRLYGNDGNDHLHGGIGNDRLHGGTGDDRLLGDGGDDTLSGEEGKDDLFGGWGNDVLYGGGGNDRIYGEDGSDYLYGEGDDDTLVGGAGNDWMVGGAGNDWLYGQADADHLFGNEGDDVLQGEAGDDDLDGGTGNDTLMGGGGADRLFGGDGVDRLYGMDGDDVLAGGRGADRLWGDDQLAGADIFQFLAGDLVTYNHPYLWGATYQSVETDFIGDFNAAQGDRIDLSSLMSQATNFAGGTAADAIAQGYLYYVERVLLNDLGNPYSVTTVYLDRNGHSPDARGVGDIAVAELYNVGAAELGADSFIVGPGTLPGGTAPALSAQLYFV